MLDLLFRVLIVCGCILAGLFTLCLVIVLVTAIGSFVRDNWKK